MTIDERLCWFCKYFYYRNQEDGYSQVTPGADFEIECLKGHWDFDAYRTTQQEFGRYLRMAVGCPDFQLDGEIARQETAP